MKHVDRYPAPSQLIIELAAAIRAHDLREQPYQTGARYGTWCAQQRRRAEVQP